MVYTALDEARTIYWYFEGTKQMVSYFGREWWVMVQRANYFEFGEGVVRKGSLI
jgi:hypothetical protein